MKFATALLVVLAALLFSAQTGSRSHSPAYLSMERKVEAMQRFEENPTARGLTTVMTDAEMNAWFAEGGVEWSPGVSNVRIESKPAVVAGTATIDFEEVTAGRGGGNPLMMLFSGVHDVRVVAQATAASGRGSVRVDSVYLDDVKVPRPALEFFVERFLQPKYPEASLNSRFRMPNRIDTAIVGNGEITFVQK